MQPPPVNERARWQSPADCSSEWNKSPAKHDSAVPCMNSFETKKVYLFIILFYILVTPIVASVIAISVQPCAACKAGNP